MALSQEQQRQRQELQQDQQQLRRRQEGQPQQQLGTAQPLEPDDAPPEGETEAAYLMRRAREFNVATRERPEDLQMWLAFAAFQDEALARWAPCCLPTSASARHIPSQSPASRDFAASSRQECGAASGRAGRTAACRQGAACDTEKRHF